MRLALARAALLDDVGLCGGQPTVRRDGLAAVTRGRPGAEGPSRRTGSSPRSGSARTPLRRCLRR